MLSIRYLFEDEDLPDRSEMEQYFEDRTNYHIGLVCKYLDKIKGNDSRADSELIEEQKNKHDESKFEDPEYEPYIHVNWKYKMKDAGINYDPGKEIEKQMQAATFHHVKTNEHHPEFWDGNSTIESINSKDRDKPPERMVDATKMPLYAIIEMVADWCAMSEEKGTDPYKWCEMNINKRWKFTEEQVKLIYDLLEKIWKKK